MKITKCITAALVVLMGSISMTAQHEVIVEDIGANGDAVIEIVVDSLDNISPRKMILGLNQSSEGFLRMRTDHDLSFWTFNQKRMTVTNTGEVGIGTSAPLEKLFIKNGSLGIETETSGLFGDDERSTINFYTGNDYEAGIVYGDTQADGKFMQFNVSGKSAFYWQSDFQTRMRLNTNGSLQIDDLEGTGTRPVFADDNGVLIDDPTLHVSVDGPEFVVDALSRFDGSCIYVFNGVRADLDLFVDKFDITASPAMPHAKYLIEEITYFFLDNVSNLDMTFSYDILPLQGALISDLIVPSVNSSILNSITLSVNEEVDESIGELFTIGTRLRSEDHRLQKVVIKYTPL